jgi:hypothetical protein
VSISQTALAPSKISIILETTNRLADFGKHGRHQGETAVRFVLATAVRRGLYACVLPTATRQGCEQKVEAGASGQFEISMAGLT